jgi:hypothetical protein
MTTLVAMLIFYFLRDRDAARAQKKASSKKQSVKIAEETAA